MNINAFLCAVLLFWLLRLSSLKMSDYRSNQESNDILNTSVDGENNHSSTPLSNRFSLFEREDGISSQDNVFNRFETSRKSHHLTEMFRPSSPQNDRNYTDVSYIGEVERVSSNLIRLLRMAGQRRKTAPAGRIFLLTDNGSETVGATGGRNCSISLGTTKNRQEDTYDKIEERSFSRTAEPKDLLAEDTDRSKNQKKDSVLSEPVEIIKELRKSQDHVRQLEDKLRERGMQVKELALRLERLEVFNNGKPTNMRGTNLQELRSDTLKTPSQTVTRGVVMDDLSTTASESSTTSSYGKNSDNMDCYN